MDGIASPAQLGFVSVAGHVTDKFTEVTGRLAEKARSLTFGFEPFKSLVSIDKTVQQFPFAEMLARHSNTGKSAGHIFDEARQHNCVINTDLVAFQKAVQTQLDLNIPVSINLNAETFFSEELVHTLTYIATTHPNFHPRDICLEITEQGGIPENFNPNALLALRHIGFTLALDDFNPAQMIEQKRLSVMAPYVDVIKFPHEVMATFRTGNFQQQALQQTIEAIKETYPSLKFVMEGVRADDEQLLPTLKYAGIDYIQSTSYVPEAKVDLSKSMGLALQS